MPLIVHRAERADALVAGLASVLAEPPSDPFERDVVVVAAAGVERWLAQSVSHAIGAQPGRQDGICAGVEFVRPAHLVAEVTDRADDDPWAPRRLAWTLHGVIDAEIDEPWLRIVARHVGRGLPEREEAMRRSRRYATARRTASLLHGYAVQRPWMVQAWAEGHDVDGQGRDLPPETLWQPELWRRATTLLAPHPSPDRRLADTATALRADASASDLPQRVSFVGHTRMPWAELDVVAALATHREVHLWLPHPSRSRWETVAEPATSVGGAGVLPRADVPTPTTGNTLLSACARDASELEQALLGLDAHVDVEHLPGPEHPQTVLGRLQADLSADRDGPPPGETRTVVAADRSLQVHACHGPARQVDVLREVVLGLLQDDPTLEPRDVLVMCPDVETYAPLVEAAFGLSDVDGVTHPGHQLRVKLADRATTSINPVAEVLQRVVAIAAGRRTTVAQVRDLLSLAPVRRRFALSDEDLEQIDDWVVGTAIRWGLDADARSAWGLGGLEQNSWRAGLDQLALGVAVDPQARDGDVRGNRLGGVLPLDDLASTEIDLVGRLSEAVARLATVVLAPGTQSLRAWVDVLTTAVRTLTDVPARDAWQREQVLRVLAGLADDGAGDGSGHLTVVEIGAVLDDAFAPRPSRTSFRTGSLTVCTMVPMRSVPHRVVCLLGLDAERFPRSPTPLGDDVLARHPLVGERDAAGEDRQLFLDAVLSATEHLVVTYTGASEFTGRPLPAATPVGELLDQLDRTFPGTDVRDHVVTEHPLQAFDARSFQPGAIVPDVPFSFDEDALAGARASQHRPTPWPPLVQRPLPDVAVDVLTLDQLRRFVAHPVRSFFRDRLDIVLPYEDGPDDDAIPLHLDHLQQWQVKERVLEAVLGGMSGADAEDDERRSGRLPPGPLGTAVLDRARGDVQRILELADPLRTEPARSVDVEIALLGGRRVVGTVPQVHPEHALRVTASTLQGRQLLLAWVDTLALAAAGRPVPVHLVGRVKADRGKAPGRRTFTPPSPEDAVGLLGELVGLWMQGMSEPLPLPVKTSQAYAEAMRRQQPRIAAKMAENEWIGNRDKDIDGEDADPYLVRVFGERAPLTRLLDLGLERHALTLWTRLLDHLGAGA